MVTVVEEVLVTVVVFARGSALSDRPMLSSVTYLLDIYRIKNARLGWAEKTEKIGGRAG